MSSCSLVVFQRSAKQGIHCCTKTLSPFQPKTMYPDSFPCDESLPSSFLVPHMLIIMESQPHILAKTCLNSTVTSTSTHVVWWAGTLQSILMRKSQWFVFSAHPEAPQAIARFWGLCAHIQSFLLKGADSPGILRGL